MQLQLAAESHVPCFQERVGTSIPGYMIPDRLPWRLRARPSATLHEIGSAPKSELVGLMVLQVGGGRQGGLAADSFWPSDLSPQLSAFSFQLSAFSCQLFRYLI